MKREITYGVMVNEGVDDCVSLIVMRDEHGTLAYDIATGMGIDNDGEHFEIATSIKMMLMLWHGFHRIKAMPRKLARAMAKASKRNRG